MTFSEKQPSTLHRGRSPRRRECGNDDRSQRCERVRDLTSQLGLCVRYAAKQIGSRREIFLEVHRGL
jgi:hypothetical protein